MWKMKRGKTAGQDVPILNKVPLIIDCRTKKSFTVHVKGLAVFQIDDPAVAKRARRVPHALDELSASVHDVFARHLRSVVETFAWDEMIRDRARLLDQICAASEPEMRGLGLKIYSFDIPAVDFPEDSEPSIALRTARAHVIRRKAQEAAAAAAAAGGGAAEASEP